MTKVAVVYSSSYGHTEAQALAIKEGAASVIDVDVNCYHTDIVCDKLIELNAADALIFGSPTYMGSVSASFKKFIDSTSNIWIEQSWKNKIAAGFTNGGSLSGDKLNTLIQLVIFAAQHGMIWIGQAEIDKSASTQVGDPNAINRMGTYLGAMAQSDNAPATVTPPAGDLATARILGARVARLTQKFKFTKNAKCE